MALDGARMALAALSAAAVLGFAIAAAAARLHFQIALCAFLALLAAAASAASFGAPLIAAALALAAGVGFAVSAAFILLTAPATAPRRRKLGALFVAALLIAALGWAGRDLAAARMAAPSGQEALLSPPIALALLVAAIAAYALLGFGERAVFTRRSGDE